MRRHQNAIRFDRYVITFLEQGSGDNKRHYPRSSLPEVGLELELLIQEQVHVSSLSSLSVAHFAASLTGTDSDYL